MAREFYGKYGGPRANMQAFLDYLRSREATPDEARAVQDTLVRKYGLYRIAERIEDGHLVLNEGRVGWSDTTQGSGIASGDDPSRSKEWGPGSKVSDIQAQEIERRRRQEVTKQQSITPAREGSVRAGEFGTKGQETIGYLRVPGGPVNVVELDTFRVTKLSAGLFEIDVDGSKSHHSLFNLAEALMYRASSHGTTSQVWMPKVNKWAQETAEVGQSLLVQMHSGDHVIIDSEGYRGQQQGW